MFKARGWFLLVVIALATWLAAQGWQQRDLEAVGPLVALESDSATQPAHTPFELSVVVYDVVDLAGLELDVAYDDTFLNIASLTLTNALGESVACDPQAGRCAAPLGLLTQGVNLGATRSLGAYSYGEGTGLTGSATVATLLVEPTGVTGTTTLFILSPRFSDSLGNGSAPASQNITLELVSPTAVSLRQSHAAPAGTYGYALGLALLGLGGVTAYVIRRRRGEHSRLWLLALCWLPLALTMINYDSAAGFDVSSAERPAAANQGLNLSQPAYLRPIIPLGEASTWLHRPDNAVGLDPDVDSDGLITVLDIQQVAAVWGLSEGEPGWDPALDLSGDGQITLADLELAAGLWKVGLLQPHTSPSPGEVGVAQTRETIIFFDRPINPTSLSADSLTAEFGGALLPADLHLAPDGRRATLFYQAPLPSNARVRVTLQGDEVVDTLGYAIDADGDGRAGGTLTFDFDTLNLTTLPGTRVCGRVFASELAPGDGGGSVNTPLEGATITVDGAEDTLFTLTDNMGNFCLDPAPVGRFFVHIDGRTAINDIPPGAYYPYVGKAWESIAGQTHSVGDAFLPLIAPGALQPVSQTEETEITFPPEVIGEHPELEGVQITVPADALFADDGTRGGEVGIAPVPPDRLPGALPPDLNFPIVITVQTDGPTNFDLPAPICFPNLPDPDSGETPAPGTPSALWSFNHDDGRWHVVGPMTVTADGMLVCADPGYGILAPGWHGEDPGSEGDFGEGGGGDGDCDEGGDCGPPPCPEPDDFKKYKYACSFGAGLGVGGCWTFNQGVEDLCGTLVSEYLCEQIIEGSDDCAAQTAELGKACMARLNECMEDFFDFPLQMFPPGPMSASAAPIPPYGTWPEDLEEELEEVIVTAQSIITDVIDQVALQDAIAIVLDGADSDDDLTPEQWEAFLPLLEQFNALTGGRGPQEFYNPRLDRLSQLVDVIEAELHLLDTPTGWYVLENLDNGLVQRGVTDANGALNGLFLAPETHYVLYRLIPQGSGFNFPQNEGGFGLTRAEFFSPAAGFALQLGRSGWTYDVTPDSDGDGLSELEEFVVGTLDSLADSDSDGVNDATELLQGTDPLENVPSQTGLIGTVDTPGTAVDVCGFNDIVVVADSSAGISVFNAFDNRNPIVIAQVNTPGAASRVGCAPAVARVAVADGTSGVAIIDITDPPAASIVHQVQPGGTVQAVAVEANLAYVGTTTGALHVIDLLSGDVLGTTYLTGSVKDIQIGRSAVYVLTSTQLHSLARFQAGWQTLSSIASPYVVADNRRLFVGEGLAYATHPRGYNTFDLSNPLAPSLVAAGDTAQFGWLHLVDNGAGLGVAAVGLNLNPDNTGDVRLYDVTDPTETDAFLTTYETPGSARAATLYNGLGYLADGANGLQVVAYLAFDAAGQPPTVTLSTNYPAGVAEQGQVLQLSAAVTDDVQVGRVLFYVDGQQVNSDGNYPFTFSLVAPNEPVTLTLQAQAYDTGGNAAWSNELAVTLVPDASPPLVTQATPTGGLAAGSVAVVTAYFNEPVAAATLTTASFLVTEAGADGLFGTADDIPFPADALTYLSNQTGASLTFNAPLPIGNYQATLLASVTDLAGNALGAEHSWTFSLREAVSWVNPAGGLWSTASNWSSGVVPTSEDVVVIDLPGVYTVDVRGARSVSWLSITNPSATLWVQTTSADETTLTVLNDLLNEGVIEIETTATNHPATLEVVNGRLVNSGTLAFRSGNNLNSRILRANLFNSGLIEVDYSALWDKAGAEIINEGSIIILTGKSVTVSGLANAFYQIAGEISGGALTIQNSGNFFLEGGVVTGLTPLISSSQLNFGPSAAGPASFRTTGSSTLSGDIPAEVEVWINGGAAGTATLTAAQGFTNRGTLRLETTTSNWPSTLTVSNGALVNEGTIDSNIGNNLNSRNLNGWLDNQGTVNVNYSLTMAQSDAVITNTGTIHLASSRTLNISGGTPTVQLVSGIITGTGTLQLTSGVVNLTAQTADAASIQLLDSALNFSPGAVGTGTWRMGGDGGQLSGDIPAGVTLWVNGGLDGGATVVADSGLTNRGIIRIETSASNWPSTLTVNNGALVNEGTIDSNVGNNLSSRNLNASLDNQGTLNVNYSLNMTLSGASVANSETINLASGKTLSISNGTPTVHLAAGAITGTGTFKLTSGVVNFTAQTADAASIQLLDSALNFSPGAVGTGTWRMGGDGSQLSGDIPAGVTLWVNGGLDGGATVVADSGLTNRGIIRLETTTSNWPSTLTVNNGVLVNEGTIDSNVGNNLNSRNLNASLDNQGTVNVNYSLNMALSGASVANSGTINLASGKTLSISNGTPTVHLAAGAITGTGTLQLTSGVVNFTTQTADAASIQLLDSALNFSPGAVGTGTWRMGGDGSQLSGDIPAGVTLWVNGGLDGGATVVADSGLTNRGAIRIETSAGNWPSTLTVNNGALVNEGTIDSNVGNNLNSRNLHATLDNQGTVNVNYSLTLNQAGAAYTNSGVIVIASGRTLRFQGGGSFTNAAGGMVQGTGTLRVDEVTPSNSGIIAPGASPGTLTITGNWPHTSDSQLNMEIGGLTVGSQYDRAAISGVATLDGTLSLTLIDGFEPAVGDTFQIMTFASHSGAFAAIVGLEIGNGKLFEVSYNSGNVTLEVVAAP